MKSDVILALHAERCNAREIAAYLRMRVDNVQRVIRHRGYPVRRDAAQRRACAMVARFRA